MKKAVCQEVYQKRDRERERDNRIGGRTGQYNNNLQRRQGFRFQDRGMASPRRFFYDNRAYQGNANSYQSYRPYNSQYAYQNVRSNQLSNARQLEPPPPPLPPQGQRLLTDSSSQGAGYALKPADDKQAYRNGQPAYQPNRQPYRAPFRNIGPGRRVGAYREEA